jgi:hypothetical protein
MKTLRRRKTRPLAPEPQASAPPAKYEAARVCEAKGCMAHVVPPAARCPWCHNETRPLEGFPPPGETLSREVTS